MCRSIIIENATINLKKKSYKINTKIYLKDKKNLLKYKKICFLKFLITIIFKKKKKHLKKKIKKRKKKKKKKNKEKNRENRKYIKFVVRIARRFLVKQ